MSFQLFVPPLGTRLALARPWDFALFNERRNATLMAILDDDRPLAAFSAEVTAKPAALPTGTILIIDRYYIRQGLDDFDSVSFRVVGAKAAAQTYGWSKALTKRQVRFWAKLDDVNRMHVDLAPAEPAKK